MRFVGCQCGATTGDDDERLLRWIRCLGDGAPEPAGELVESHPLRPDFPVHRTLDEAVQMVARHHATVLWGVLGFVRRLLIRAGVENGEMVEALGYRIHRLFLGVFMTGSALAGLGGVMWALYREQVHASMSDDLTVLIFIVVIIGGLGSIGGCFIGALLVAMVANYGGFLVPKLALVSNILLMVAILMWRPRGLYAVTSR